MVLFRYDDAYLNLRLVCYIIYKVFLQPISYNSTRADTFAWIDQLLCSWCASYTENLKKKL